MAASTYVQPVPRYSSPEEEYRFLEELRIKTNAILGDESAPAVSIGGGKLKLTERSTNPDKPAEGGSVIWQSDGTGLGADGDIIVGVTAGGASKYTILHTHATATTWV